VVSEDRTSRVAVSASRGTEQQDRTVSKPKEKPKGKSRETVVETVVVTPQLAEPIEQDWAAREALCAKCGTLLHPPEGLIYQERAPKRGQSQPRPVGVPEITGPDPNTVLELICESCFDRRPPQDKTRARRLAKKWWKTGEV